MQVPQEEEWQSNWDGTLMANFSGKLTFILRLEYEKGPAHHGPFLCKQSKPQMQKPEAKEGLRWSQDRTSDMWLGIGERQQNLSPQYMPLWYNMILGWLFLRNGRPRRSENQAEVQKLPFSKRPFTIRGISTVKGVSFYVPGRRKGLNSRSSYLLSTEKTET